MIEKKKKECMLCEEKEKKWVISTSMYQVVC